MKIVQIVLAILLANGAMALMPGAMVAAPIGSRPLATNAQPTPTSVVLESGAYTLTLAPDGFARLTEVAPTTGSQAESWSGSWIQAGEEYTIRLVASDTGAALKRTLMLEGVITDGQFAVTGIGLNDIIYDRVDLELTIGSGQRHPIVRAVNQFLSEIPYLTYTYPTTDENIYAEDVRRAVARFQEIEGLTRSGIIDLRTLLALVTPSRPRLDTSRIEFTVAPEVINVRSGPSTNYPVVQRIYQGNSFDIVGKVGGGAPRDTWLEVCCLGEQNGWIRADLGTIAGDLNRINVVPADQLPPEPTSAPSQTSDTPGQPLLANLPTTTPEGNPIVYLTFDDGPNGAYTQQVLDLLAQYNARGTFFVIGRQAASGVDTLRQMASAGSYIGNHTWDHVWLDKVSKEEFYDQIQRTRNELVAVAGDLFTLDGDVLYVRPPYGAMNASDRQWMAELGYTSVLWDVDPQDWRRPGVETIANHVTSHVFPGAVVLMHDGGGERTQSVAALEIILRELSARGYRFYNIFGQ